MGAAAVECQQADTGQARLDAIVQASLTASPSRNSTPAPPLSLDPRTPPFFTPFSAQFGPKFDLSEFRNLTFRSGRKGQAAPGSGPANQSKRALMKLRQAIIARANKLSRSTWIRPEGVQMFALLFAMLWWAQFQWRAHAVQPLTMGWNVQRNSSRRSRGYQKAFPLRDGC